MSLGDGGGSVYQYSGDPYVAGPLKVSHVALGKHFNGNPEHVTGEESTIEMPTIEFV